MTRKPLRSVGRSESELGRRKLRSGARRLRRAGPGAWQGPGFYVWDADEAEAERWARTLAEVRPANEEARR